MSDGEHVQDVPVADVQATGGDLVAVLDRHETPFTGTSTLKMFS